MDLQNPNTYNKTEWHVAYADLYEGLKNFWNAGGTFQELEECLYEAMKNGKIIVPSDTLIIELHVTIARLTPELFFRGISNPANEDED